jgi:hypothetical protein
VGGFELWHCGYSQGREAVVRIAGVSMKRWLDGRRERTGDCMD